MIEVVLDASVVLKWFATEQRGAREARTLRDDYVAGRVAVIAPPLLFLEIVNVAGRRWRWAPDAMAELADAMGSLGFEVEAPGLHAVASWVSRGLTAHDAAYVAVAEQRELELVTDDDAVVRLAPGVARPLVASRPG